MLKKYAWEKYDEKKLKKLEKLSAEYREFLDNGKTERECVDTIVNTIEAEDSLLKATVEEERKRKEAESKKRLAAIQKMYTRNKEEDEYNRDYY